MFLCRQTLVTDAALYIITQTIAAIAAAQTSLGKWRKRKLAEARSSKFRPSEASLLGPWPRKVLVGVRERVQPGARSGLDGCAGRRCGGLVHLLPLPGRPPRLRIGAQPARQ